MRSSSIDYFKTIAIFAIITLHTSPFHGYEGNLLQALDVGINQAARFAIPFFFIVSGYLFKIKISCKAAPICVFKIYVKRIIPLFLLWTVIYIIVPTDIKKQVIEYGLWEAMSKKIYWIIQDPMTLLFQGYKGHLWYLMSLVWALGIVTLFVRMNKEKWLLPVAAMLYVFGLLGGSYATTPFGINVLSFDTRNGPFFSTILVVMGCYLAGNKCKIRRSYWLGLLVLGASMHAFEVFALWKFYDVNPLRHDYLLGTLLCGVGLTAYVLSLPTNTYDKSFLAKWGKYTLGIYLLHLLIIDALTLFEKLVPFPLWDVSYPFIVYLLTICIVIALSKHRLARFMIAY